jgi:hypothetical protein
MFDMKVVVSDFAQGYPWQGDQFIMQVLLIAGYAAEMLCRLNRVQISFQLMLMSDILTASGNRVNTKILLRRPPGEAYSNMRWLHKQPTKLDIQLWQTAMLSICPSQCKTSSVGHFLGKPHRIWRGSWCKDDSTLRHLYNNSKME